MYKWTINDVFGILGITYNPNRKEVSVKCPFCGSNHFSMNMVKGIGHCWKCDRGADSASFYAAYTGMSLRDARNDIEEKLNIKDWNNNPLPPRIVYKETPEQEEALADIKVRDRTYRAFLDELLLSEKNMAMLLSRGFNKSTIEALGYKTFPGRNEVNFFSICKRLIENGCTLEGVPGFFRTKKGEGDWTFVSYTKGIIMPSIDINNHIAYLQIRKDDDLRVFNEETGKLEAKCTWFSSGGLSHGTKARAELHFACDMVFDKDKQKYQPVVKDTFALTEGIMKADLAHDLMPNIPLISIPGVRNYKHIHEPLRELKAMGVKKILHCFDMDFMTKEEVRKAMEVVKGILEKEGFEYHFQAWETKVQVKGELVSLLNGIDDYLAFQKKGIVPQIKVK